MPLLISSNETTYVDKKNYNRDRSIDFLHIPNNGPFKDQSSLLTADIEKPSDSVDHQFLINVPKAFGFEKN